MEQEKQEIHWISESKYVDMATGEEITKDVAIRGYVIIHKKKITNVTKKTGVITWINECKTSGQGRLFE